MPLNLGVLHLCSKDKVRDHLSQCGLVAWDGRIFLDSHKSFHRYALLYYRKSSYSNPSLNNIITYIDLFEHIVFLAVLGLRQALRKADLDSQEQ